MLKLLHRLSYKYGRYYIPNLMLYIIIGQIAIFAADYIFQNQYGSISQYLTFDRSLILAGQVWRVVSFIIVPPVINPIVMVFFMSLYYMIGKALEDTWGGFCFNVYYFMGVIFAIISGFIAGYTDITALNLTLFLAFAILYPKYPIYILFLIPVKIKYIAIADLVILAIMFIFADFSGKLTIGLSLVNLIVFFWNDFYPKIRDNIKYRKVRQNWNRYNPIESRCKG
ncbi:MAG: hypothetical protein LBM41_04465 [Ruminococcus sp.]|nr:hypothetical protein [Ruminococcus sp.]